MLYRINNVTSGDTLDVSSVGPVTLKKVQGVGFIGAAQGWLAPAGAPPAPEDLAAHLSEIEDRTGYGLPLSVADEMAMVIDAYRRPAK